MIRYTTPTITLTIENFSFPEECDIYVTLEQGTNELTKSDAEITTSGNNSVIKVTLTQAESGSFKQCAPVYVQVNWIDSLGVRNATKIAQVTAFENLLDKVIQYGA